MGKGGGCVPSKKNARDAAGESSNAPIAIEENAHADNPADMQIQGTVSQPAAKLKIFIVFYSMYGHVEGLAWRMKKGVDGVDGVEGVLYRVAETLPNEVLEKMRAPPKDDRIPEITAAELAAADGILFGFPTRYGCMAAQMKAFFDSTGQLWKEQKLAGKPAGFFVSTGTQGGGQETTAWTAITQLAHHGMLFIPIGYTFGTGMFKMDSVRGGSPYGAGVFAGDGTREPSETELALAEHQGKYMAAVVKRWHGMDCFPPWRVLPLCIPGGDRSSPPSSLFPSPLRPAWASPPCYQAEVGPTLEIESRMEMVGRMKVLHTLEIEPSMEMPGRIGPAHMACHWAKSC